MTVALHDVVLLRSLIADVDDFRDWDKVKDLLSTWYWRRKSLSATVNILSVALYDLFGADSTRLEYVFGKSD